MEKTALDESISLLEKKAIKAAMKGAWDQAIEFNQKILKLEPTNAAAFNRLGRAYGEKGHLADAKKSFDRVLKIDPYNTIAIKNLQRLADQSKTSTKKTPNPPKNNGVLFLEEPGKTKIVKLVRLADPKVLAHLDSADEVFLVPKQHTISVADIEKTYLGAIPDDLSHRLLPFMKGGNEYEACVKTVDRQSLEIFIKETKRVPKFLNRPSFISPLISANSLPLE